MNEQAPGNSTGITFDGPRPARLEEREDLIAMINLVFRVSVGREPTIGSDYPHVYGPENLANVMVISARVNDGGSKVVASTGLWASDVAIGDVKVRLGGINCVGTLPDYRRHGFGSQVMAASMQRMRELGCHVGLLSTGIANWYWRMGWAEGGVMRSYRLNRGNVGLLPSLGVGQAARFITGGAAGWDEQSVTEVVRLHNNARLGAVRTVEGFRQRAAAQRLEHIVLAESEDESEDGSSAYLLLRQNGVMEWGGRAEDVAGLLRWTFEWLDDATVSTSLRVAEGGSAPRNLALDTPSWQHPLVKLLDEVRIPYHDDYLGMLLVVDPQAILAAYGLSSVHVEAVGEKFACTYRGERVTLDRNQLAKLFFGPERVSAFGADIFPLPLWQWRLEKV